jgi:hypothetical protein
MAACLLVREISWYMRVVKDQDHPETLKTPQNLAGIEGPTETEEEVVAAPL